MPKGVALAKWTAKRQEWLETLEREPTQRTSLVGYQCMRLGWTSWKDIGASNLEVITDAGREKLAEWRAAQADSFAERG